MVGLLQLCAPPSANVCDWEITLHHCTVGWINSTMHKWGSISAPGCGELKVHACLFLRPGGLPWRCAKQENVKVFFGRIGGFAILTGRLCLARRGMATEFVLAGKDRCRSWRLYEQPHSSMHVNIRAADHRVNLSTNNA